MKSLLFPRLYPLLSARCSNCDWCLFPPMLLEALVCLSELTFVWPAVCKNFVKKGNFVFYRFYRLAKEYHKEVRGARANRWV